MLLNITGEIPLRVENIRPDTASTRLKRFIAELVVEKSRTLCIIRQVTRGNLERLKAEPVETVSIMIFPRVTHMDHAGHYVREGYVDVMITTQPAQFFAYVHSNDLEGFLSACAMSAIRTGLKL